MLTKEALAAFGANVNEGLGRCINNEKFYLMLVGKALADDSPERLAKALESGDKQTAFEIAHSMKGVFGNLSVTPIYETASKLTELLRTGEDADYKAYSDALTAQINELRSL